jgi:4-hydroxy-tetrahydrodipicolinate synthase
MSALRGVFPVIPTPFDAALQPDADSLRSAVRYLLACNVDGMTYPGVASEVGQLSLEERLALTRIVLEEVNGQVPVIVGASHADPTLCVRIIQAATDQGARTFMVAVPADRVDEKTQIEYFRTIHEGAPAASIMLQNVPPPAGAGLAPEALLALIRETPYVKYVKEETLPSGQRLSALMANAPSHLQGVFGGAGGRYITDELRRGAAGTMPAIELAEIHLALFNSHRGGDAAQVRHLFTRMLPILNVQAVFRWSLTKYVLKKRGIIAHDTQRASGPRLDATDQQDVDAFLSDLDDLLIRVS